MITPELIRYVRENLSQGIPVQDIVQGLRDAGWSGEDIASAFHEAQSSVVPPPTPHPLANSTTPTVASPSTIQKPTHKKLLIGLILSLLVIVIGAGGAYAYFVVLNPPPQAVLDSVADNIKTIHSFTADTKITATVIASGSVGTNQLPPSSHLATTTADFLITIDKTLPDTPKLSADLSATVTFDSMSFSGAGHMILLGDRFYFMIEKIPFLDTLLQGSQNNIFGTWITYNRQEMIDFLKATGMDEKSLASAQAKLDQTPLKQSLSQKETDELSALAKKNPPVIVKEQLPADMIDGQGMFHYQLAIDMPHTLDLYRYVFSKLNPSADTAAIDAEIESIKKATADMTIDTIEIWIGKNDRFIHRLLLTSHQNVHRTDAGLTDTNTRVALTIDTTIKDYNKQSTISAPMGAKSLITDILGPSLNTARSKKSTPPTKR